MLKIGDRIGIIAPAGEVADTKKLDGMVQSVFKEFNVKVFPSCYSAKDDKMRLKDLHDAFLDESIKAIICARGGYGALRIVDDIDYTLISDYPKIFAGSSDITILLLNMYKRSHLKVFHSPMALNGFCEGVLEDFFNTVNNIKQGILPNKDFKTLNGGESQGILWGGNLATLVSLFGSDPKTYVPKENIVLFLEDLNEPVYKIDRMLRQIYRNKELRERVCGLVFGDFLESDNEKGLYDTLKEYSELFRVPAAFGYPITHLETNTTIPIGQMVNFNSQNGIISFV